MNARPAIINNDLTQAINPEQQSLLSKKDYGVLCGCVALVALLAGSVDLSKDGAADLQIVNRLIALFAISFIGSFFSRQQGSEIARS